MTDAELKTEHAALLAEHRQLEVEHQRLHLEPWDTGASKAHINRLRQHLEHVYAYVQALHEHVGQIAAKRPEKPE